ncbi:hypothetical protein H310_13635 [Aphanomyces invadans]|uniref:Uncharacterized protein n=1 Tax=Aphanomyces invadans TaxID=157072 RepID=A0A024TCA8_9STRA|nr:hypothetical protein H310_13635 [Aphanomyces invadans]ETV91790.1 hypothetical protein H310_13635 [Aphanomyces invadans]|eukprot:XP_008879427.1 hypothetical protein H310_13635 [Aphanomyces invadans]
MKAMKVMNTPHHIQPAIAPEVEEQYSSSPLEFQLVTGTVTTSNRYALLQEDDLELPWKAMRCLGRPNKSKHAHFERTAKLIREKVAESNILACTRLLRPEPQVVAHSMYPAEGGFGLLEALATTRTIHRLMASHTVTGDSGDYTMYLPFYAKAAKTRKS